MSQRKKTSFLWSELAGKVAVSLPLKRWHPAVTAWQATRGKRHEVWAVALSGGADSVALLLALWAHWPEQRNKLVAVHFNHRLRGRDSLADERFCRRLCTGLGIALEVGRWRDAYRGASEAVAREARQAFLGAVMKGHRAKVLWLAHQQDDVAETQLMRLARGSGLAGLVAPRPAQLMADGRWHLRPLLTFKKAELIGVLRSAGVEWREDRSNQSGQYFRNRVRHDVVPHWVNAAGRDAVAGAALSRDLLEEDAQALDAWAEEIYPPGRERVLALASLGGLPRAVVRRVLHQWLSRVKPTTDLSRQGFEVLLAAVHRGAATRFSLGAKGFAVIRRGQLSYCRS